MKRGTRVRLLKHVHVKEAWVILFVLGIIMMNYPFIHIFQKPGVLLFGVPVLFIYLYAGWLVSIAVIKLFVKAIELHGDIDKGEPR